MKSSTLALSLLPCSIMPATAFWPPTTAYRFCPAHQVRELRFSDQKLLVAWPSSGLRRVTIAAAQAAGLVEEQPPVRIGIIGGGVAGISVAHALSLREHLNCSITVLEAGMPPPASRFEDRFAPPWAAATAKNGNSIVPGASFYIFAQPSALWSVLSDTVKEWYAIQKERLERAWQDGAKTTVAEDLLLPTKLWRGHDFAVVPPYFALHLWRCLGPSSTSAERWSFVHFGRQYLKASFLGEPAARAQHLVDLSSANRTMYLAAVEKDSELAKYIGHNRGFLAVYRTLADAEEAVDKVRAMGEEAELLQWDAAVVLEPRLNHVPIKPLFVVRRPNDYTANCNDFVRAWIRECQARGVDHRANFAVERIERIKKKGGYRVTGKDGSTHEFDLVVLAAGVEAPLLAAQLGAAKYCPTYPLRGFSLTIFAWQQEQAQAFKEKKDVNQQLLLQQPFKLDGMYCSSVSPWMARWVGFGEFAGYRTSAEEAPSVGPSVLSRYARTIFPGASHTQAEHTVTCFRPMSPDDLPILGEVPSRPGLFLHTGHGSLGWTMGLATGECVAQAIAAKLEGRKESNYRLPNGTTIDQKILSPTRFKY